MSLLGPLARRDLSVDLSDQLMARLADRIISGELTGGQKLSEPKLARAYGVSRGPMREAIRRLEERNLITRSVNQGARVQQFSALECLELLQIREALEGLSARLASQNLPEEEVRDLRAKLQRHHELLQGSHDGDGYPDPEDVNFHFRVAQGSGNSHLQRLLCQDLYAIYRLCWHQHGFNEARGMRAVVEHMRIAEAIAERDGDLAELLMRRHVAAARHNYERMLASSSEPAAAATHKPVAARDVAATPDQVAKEM